MKIKALVLKVVRKLVKLLFQLEIEEKQFIKMGEKQYEIPIISGLGYSNVNSFEPWMQSLLMSLTKLNPILFIDVGVNVGQTLLKVKSSFKDIKYIGFEPNPSCVYYVNELIKRNNIANAEILPVGISDTSGLVELQFYSDAEGDSSASIIKDFRPNGLKSIFVPVFSPKAIKPLNENYIGIQIVKIDVEGAEFDVIKGLESYIDTNRPIVILEILPVYNSDNRFRIERQEKLLALMRIYNYKFYRIIKSDTGELFDFQLIKEIEIHSNMDNCEYILIHESLNASFKSLIINQFKK